MQIKDVLAGYRRVLEANPGKALYIGSGNVAVLKDGHLCGAPLDAANNKADLDDLFDFDASAFDDTRGCWADDASSNETAAYFERPRFVSL